MILTPEIRTTVRAVAMAGGVWLINRGALEEHQLEMFAGGAVAIAAFLFQLADAWQKRMIQNGVKNIQSIYNESVSPDDRIAEDGRPGPITQTAIATKLK